MADGARRSGPVSTVAAGDVYTMAEAARLKGVSYHTVSRAVRRGTLPSRRLGRMVFVSVRDLQAWRPMVERAPRKYRNRVPQTDAAPALIDLASGERVELARRLSALLEVIHLAARERPLDEFLTLLCDRLAQALDFRRAEVWGVDQERGMARRLATFGQRMNDLPDELSLSQAPDFVRFLDGANPGAQSEGGSFGEPPASLDGKSTLFAVPLRVGDRALGILFGDCDGEPFELSPEQLVLAQALANHAALALELAQLRAEVASLRR